MSNHSNKDSRSEAVISGAKMKRLAQDRMVTDIPVAHPDHSLGQVELALHRNIKKLESINYIYVTDEVGHLQGVFSIKELFEHPKETKVRDVMEENPVAIFLKSHQERAAITAITHSIKSVPVVDRERRLLGVIPFDEIVKILNEENTKDVLQSVGVRSDNINIAGFSAYTLYVRRLPWLVVGLLGGVGAAMIIELFEATIELHVLIAAFIPAVVYIADAVGTQTQTLFIRSMAIEQKFNLARYAFRESRIGLMLAGSLSLLAGIFVYLRWQDSNIGIIVILSFFIAIIIAILVAMLLPLLFTKLKKDPAVASGPFASVLRDLTTLVVYFSIAEYILSRNT
jgi:magnesium transporter